jgi:hypothetical protein
MRLAHVIGICAAMLLSSGVTAALMIYATACPAPAVDNPGLPLPPGPRQPTSGNPGF